MNEQDLSLWLGREQCHEDFIDINKAQAMAATLNWTAAASEQLQLGSELPWPWHWLYFLETPAAALIEVDGHPRKGDFLPPVTLPRRMWAGSRLQFFGPLHIGDHAKKVSQIKSVTEKQGASGRLVFVTVQHSVFTYRGRDNKEFLLMTEEQDIVYREAAVVGAAPAKIMTPKYQAEWSETVTTDPVLLFRYSALTFNSHRIHYDRQYAIEQEAYPGLVVQGPLMASLLLNFAAQNMPEATLSHFEFKGLRPATGEQLQLQGCVEGQKLQLWALDEQGAMVMKASADINSMSKA